MKARTFQVVDLGFGDSGKGTLVDYLTARHNVDLIVRFNGGPQAGHNVVLADGRHHTFAQFGSGMFISGVHTLLSRFMLIEPYAMLNEAEHLASVGVPDALARTFVDGRCRVITPPQQIANRVRERVRGPNRHGTCGMGVGECMDDAISQPELTLLATELADRSAVRWKLRNHLELKRSSLGSIRNHMTFEDRRVFDDPSWIEIAVELFRNVAERLTIVSPEKAGQILRSSNQLVFEGAQGVLLDERLGFQPHTTWSTTTYENSDALLDESQSDLERIRIGVMRTYMTRHGQGPLVTEDEQLDQRLPEPHNNDGGWQGRFRRGVLDFVLLRYAIAACGRVDALAITCLDRLPQLPMVACDSYELDGAGPWPNRDIATICGTSGQLLPAKPRYVPLTTNPPEAFIAAVESALEVDTMYHSTGPTRNGKHESPSRITTNGPRHP